MIKTFEAYSQQDSPCILFINGFRHWLKDDNLDVYGKDDKTLKILSQFGNKILHGSIDWKSSEYQIDEIRRIIDNNNIVGIVGFSAGGYVSFNLSNEYDIPALSINPAMASTSSAPTLQPIRKSSLFPDQIVVIGEEDTKDLKGVDGELVKNDLEKMKFEDMGGEVVILEDTRHLITNEQFDGVFKHFYKKYVR